MKYRFTFVFLLCSSSSLALVFVVFLYFIGNNPIEINGKLDYTVVRFVPQGWAFFTRSPREAQILLYKVTGEKKLQKYHQKHTSLNNLFGIDRKSSKLLTEIQGLKSIIPDSLFVNSKWNYQKDSSITYMGTEAIYNVKNEVYDPLICGKHALVFQKPIPWAWLKSSNDLLMPAKIIFLQVECDGNIKN